MVDLRGLEGVGGRGGNREKARRDKGLNRKRGPKWKGRENGVRWSRMMNFRRGCCMVQLLQVKTYPPNGGRCRGVQAVNPLLYNGLPQKP